MAVTIEEVRAVARLARLEFSPAEEERLARELNRILEYMEKLDELDTEGIEPTSHGVPVVSSFREDRSSVFPGRELFAESAPQMERGYFKVPRILD